MKPTDSIGLWAKLERAGMIPELQKAMSEIVKRIVCDPLEHYLADLVLTRCGTRPIFFEQGMSIVMIASAEAREVFRARLVECGAFLEAMRLASIMGCPLLRAEVVALGNNHMTSFEIEEVKKFLACVAATEGIQLLDLRRIWKQFGVDQVSIG